jgi:hypothetical protein
LLDWDVEVLLGIKEALEAQCLAIELLLKSTFDSDPGTSIATSKAMDVITDPDSAFEAYLRSGEVSLSGLSPVERLGVFGPFAAWTSKAYSQSRITPSQSTKSNFWFRFCWFKFNSVFLGQPIKCGSVVLIIK